MALQYENPRALPDDEAVSLGVEGAAGLLWLVVAPGKGPHIPESGHGDGADGRLAAARQHHVHLAAGYKTRGGSDGVGST